MLVLVVMLTFVFTSSKVCDRTSTISYSMVCSSRLF